MDYKSLFQEEQKRSTSLFAIVQMISGKVIDNNSVLKNKKVAIYGIGMMGEALFSLFEHIGVEVVYAIDRRGGIKWNGIDVYIPGQNLPFADLIIITIDKQYKEMEKNIISSGIAYMSVNECIEELINTPYQYR